MGQPVKLSDELILDARVAAAAMQRSIAGQVEFWARIGRAIDGLLTSQQMTALGGAANSDAILDRLDTVDSPEGRQRVKDYLADGPYPHYFAHPEKSGYLIRIEENGRRTVGRFVNREFVALKQGKKSAAA
jgi:hypothetical protein